MVNLELSTLIDRPVEQVFAFVTKVSNLPRWQSNVKEIKQASEDPLRVGTTFTAVGEMLGRKMDLNLEVTSFEPNVVFGYKGVSGPVAIQATVTFKPAGTGTKLTLSATGDPGGIFKLAEGVLVKQLQAQFETNLAKLKTILESES